MGLLSSDDCQLLNAAVLLWHTQTVAADSLEVCRLVQYPEGYH